jgi:hypothetical protein
MTISSATALREAIRTRLMGDPALAQLPGGGLVRDEAPRGAVTPYMTFGKIISRDWSTCTETGAEHFVLIEVWSSQPGVAEAVRLAGEVTRLLHDAVLVLADHNLVSIRLTSVETRREGNGRFARATLRFRAVTELL